MKTVAAVVAQRGKIMDVVLHKGQAPCHRRKNGAEALAVAAGVADGQDAFCLCLVLCEFGNNVGYGRCARTQRLSFYIRGAHSDTLFAFLLTTGRTSRTHSMVSWSS